MRGVGDVASAHAVLDSECELVDDLGGVRGNDRGTNEGAFFVGDQFDESVAKITCIAAPDDIERCESGVDMEVAFNAIVLGVADRCDTWEREGESGSSGVVRCDLVF